LTLGLEDSTSFIMSLLKCVMNPMSEKLLMDAAHFQELLI